MSFAMRSWRPRPALPSSGESYTTSRERDAARPGWKGKATRAAQCYLFGTIFPSAPTVISCDWLPVITVIL